MFCIRLLLLSAQYRKLRLPLSVLLSVPFGLLGSFLFVNGFAALGSIPALKMILEPCQMIFICDCIDHVDGIVGEECHS